MRHLSSVALLALSLAGSAASLAAQGRIVPRCPMPNPRPMPRVEPAPMPAVPPRCAPVAGRVERTRSEVRAVLDGRVVRWEIEERFVNRGGLIGEADYLFPLPTGAAFQDLKLSIDGELVAGETLPAAEARRIYEEIVRRQRDPALVEWMGHGLLRTRIFPIQPGEERRIVVRLQSVAEREGDALRVDWKWGGAVANRAFTLTYAPGDGLGAAWSPTHALDARDRGGRRVVEARGSGDVTVLLPLRRGGSASVSLLAHAPGGEDAFALVTLAPPAAGPAEPTPRDLTLVLDVSGSMSGRKMEQARAAGRQFLASLRPQDRFRLIDFASDVRSFRDALVPATRANLREAQRYLDALDASGSTNISGALEEALRGEAVAGRLALVLFLTDGEPTVGDRDPESIAARAARRRGDRRVFTFGVGADLDAALLERLALEGRGTATFVRPEEDVERAVGVVASRLVDPAVTDLRVRAEGGLRLAQLHPQQPVDLFAGQDLVLLTRVKGHGHGRLVFEGTARGRPVRWVHDVDVPERERGNAFVARLWATQRVGWLSAERRRGGGSQEADDEIRRLGERFGIPTEFTSYFVKEPGMNVADFAGRGVAGGVATGTARGRVGTGVSLDAVTVTGATTAVAPPPAAAPQAARRERAFEAARVAAEQRAATSLSEVDAMAKAAGSDARTRRVGARAFVADSAGRWVDARFDATRRLVSIAPYSAAWFALAEQLPDLKEAFALGDRVVVAGRAVAVEVREGGARELTPAELRAILQAW